MTLWGSPGVLEQLSNFIVGLVQSVGNLVHVLYRIPEAMTGSPDAIHELEEAVELFQKTADKGVGGFSEFLSGQWIDQGIGATRDFNEQLKNIRQSTDEGVMSAEAYATALAQIGAEAEGTGRALTAYSVIAKGEKMVAAAAAAAAKEQAAATRARKSAAAAVQRAAERAQKATEDYLASIVKVSIELKSQQGSYDGIFPADFSTQADRFASSFESLGLSLVESVTELEQMQSLLSSLEAGD